MASKPSATIRGAIVAGAATAAAGLLAACGGGTAASGAGGGASHRAASPGMAISARNVPGVGTVLVNQAGKTVYAAQQETRGTIKCTGGCLSFWTPVRVAAGTKPTAPGTLARAVGTIHRSDDGLTQVTYQGQPLYTFKLDRAPGQAHGNNVTDQFAGTSFTWHAITAAGAAAGAGTSAGSANGYSSGGGAGY
ncbi:MAG: hypothetical protein J2P34_04580 [Actinobacteria bacterium]|nr:hypothetical protein [Actinomycetota bacterium]